ncbi:MAG: putative toxin-antitoxin system toxin component, PIN family, partial [Proteobacteria bacterium]|nr:putative toxin-antitoxin system toxin component, PIN family [Pseudomonadota bacterium]
MKKTKQIRAVIDTNLFVSGLFSEKGYTFELQELWVNGAFELAVSEKILYEVKSTLLKPYIKERLLIFDGEEEEIAELIREKAFLVTHDRYETDRIKTDKSDNKFLACALESNADYVVSGDNHLLELK